MVLATSIAQTSLTIEGVRVVIDAGLSRVPRYDPASGLTRLETVRVSAAAADQRRGRAGRTEPGVCYRLWDERETRGLAPFDRPEILEADLARVALDLALWGAGDGAGLVFLDPPPAAAMAEARALLQRLGALDGAGALTEHGRRMADIALPPRLAHMVLRAAASGQAERAARIAALIVERGLGGRDVDLELRLDAFRRERGQRARDAAQLARRWAAEAGAAATPERSARLGDALLLAEAWPERIAKARGAAGHFQLASGRGVYMDAAEPLAKAAWLAVAELGGGEARDRILLAAELDVAELRAAFADRLTREARLQRDAGGRLKAKEVVTLGRLALEERFIERPDPALILQALLDEVRDRGLAALPWGEAAKDLRARAAFLRSLDPDCARSCRRGADRPAGRLAGARAGRQVGARPTLRPRPRRGAEDADPARRPAPARPRGAGEVRGAHRLAACHRLRRRGRAACRRPRAGALRPDDAPDRRRRPRPAGAGAALARAQADPAHARPAGLLARRLGRGAQGDARPLPEARLARGPGRRRADDTRQAQGLDRLGLSAS